MPTSALSSVKSNVSSLINTSMHSSSFSSQIWNGSLLTSYYHSNMVLNSLYVSSLLKQDASIVQSHECIVDGSVDVIQDTRTLDHIVVIRNTGIVKIISMGGDLTQILLHIGESYCNVLFDHQEFAHANTLLTSYGRKSIGNVS